MESEKRSFWAFCLVSRGYSAVELLVVIAIITTMSVIAFPSYQQWRSTQESKKAARQVVGVLRTGRALAIATNHEHRVEFDPAQRRFRIMMGDRANSSVEWTAVGQDWEEVDGIGINMSASVEAIHFNPNGSSTLGTITISEGFSQHQYRVIITRTGRVRIS